MKKTFLGSNTIKKNVIFLGDDRTGKTSLLRMYIKKKYDENLKSTIGMDYYSKELIINDVINNSIRFYFELWDTNGVEKEKQILPHNIYKNAAAFIICCSYDSLSSLENIKIWIDHIKKLSTDKLELEKMKDVTLNTYLNDFNIKVVPLFILCNKYDLQVKSFGEDDIRTNSKQWTLSEDFKIKIYDKISAKKNLNIDHIFNKLIIMLTGGELQVNSQVVNPENSLLSSKKLNRSNENNNYDNITFTHNLQMKRNLIYCNTLEQKQILLNRIKLCKKKDQSVSFCKRSCYN